MSVNTVSLPKAEAFYWVTIMLSQTLGTALGDWTADTADQGYTGAAIVFTALLALVAVAYYRTSLSRTLLFWAAFIQKRPLGAVVGDFLDKPLNAGGLALSRYTASAVGQAGRMPAVMNSDLLAGVSEGQVSGQTGRSLRKRPPTPMGRVADHRFPLPRILKR